MSFEVPQFSPALPEMFVLAMACLVLVLDLFLNDRTRVVTYLLSQATLVGAAVLSLGQYGAGTAVTFSGMFVADDVGHVLKAFIYLTVFLAFLYSRDYLRVRELLRGEFFVLGLFAVLGMMVMISARNLLLVYLGLELLSLSLYALVAFNRDSSRASEAAMKYFVTGALASGMLLYGMSMLYGATGSLDLAQVAERTVAGEGGLVFQFGLVFLVVGIGFKFGAVPFHMWVPDVYEGAPTPVTLFVGSAPKVAAFAMVIRLLAEGLGGLQPHWEGLLAVLVILSLAVGNVIAIAQTNLKRMLAYSTISHMGFLLLGVLSGTATGYSAAMFYAVTYALTAAGGFGMIILLSRNGFEAERLEDFRGLGARSPWFAFIMLVLMFSMAGVPPTVGFYAKLAVLQAAVGVDLVWLAVVAVVFSVIGAFYYLRVVRLMYFEPAQDAAPLEAGGDLRLVISANGLALLALGIFPGALFAVCNSAFGL
jgi:NADH-quinone oxidoreductase subunit N